MLFRSALDSLCFVCVPLKVLSGDKFTQELSCLLRETGGLLCMNLTTERVTPYIKVTLITVKLTSLILIIMYVNFSGTSL